jgi:hypothetical protein
MNGHLWKPALAALFVLTSVAAHAFDYQLTMEQSCSFDIGRNTMVCKKETGWLPGIRESRGRWTAVFENAPAPLEIVRDDEHVVVLKQSVYFSGFKMISLMKKSRRFFITEVAYSDHLKADETTTTIGSFDLKK